MLGEVEVESPKIISTLGHIWKSGTVDKLGLRSNHLLASTPPCGRSLELAGWVAVLNPMDVEWSRRANWILD